MIRLRPAALLLLAALPGAAWAACNPTGSILCCTPHEELECDEIEWPRADGVEGFQTDDGIVHFHLTGLPEGLTWTGTIVKTWEPVDDETECTTDPIRTPTSGSIQSIITWSIYQNGTVIASGTDIDAETAEPVSGLVRCVFSVASFADACGYDSQSYELEQNFDTQLDSSLELDIDVDRDDNFKYCIPRHSVDSDKTVFAECILSRVGSVDEPLKVHLSGRKIRFGTESTLTMTHTFPANGNRHLSFFVSGYEWSDSLGDAAVFVRKNDENGPILAEGHLTVYFVEPVLMHHEQDGSFSDGNAASYKPYALGEQLIDIPNVERTYGHVVEIEGVVHPEGFGNEISFIRKTVGSYLGAKVPTLDLQQFEPPLNSTEPQKETTDPMKDEFLSKDSFFSGSIYNIDFPGVHFEHDKQAVGTLWFTRNNFRQYAISDRGRCSDDFFWYARVTVTCTNSDPPIEAVFTNRVGHPDDNSVGIGQTRLSVD